MASDLTDFIIAQLSAQGVRVRNGSASNLMAYCFNGHDHKSASLSIRRLDGAFWCFGCGARGRNWNHIKTYLPGVELLPDSALPDESAVIAEKLRGKLRRAVLEMKIPWDVTPWSGAYRSVTQYTLDAVGACKWFDSVFRCHRILFPVTIEGELHGWAARRLDASKENKYHNSTGFKAKELLYPFDLVSQMQTDTIVLVEGPYDALRLVNLNIPALCLFGTKNYMPAKKGLIARLGIERVVLALDADSAGTDARLDMAMDLRTLFEVQHFHPPPKHDPGNMPRDAVDYLDDIVRRRVTPAPASRLPF